MCPRYATYRCHGCWTILLLLLLDNAITNANRCVSTRTTQSKAKGQVLNDMNILGIGCKLKTIKKKADVNTYNCSLKKSRNLTYRPPESLGLQWRTTHKDLLG